MGCGCTFVPAQHRLGHKGRDVWSCVESSATTHRPGRAEVYFLDRERSYETLAENCLPNLEEISRIGRLERSPLGPNLPSHLMDRAEPPCSSLPRRLEP